VQPVLSDGRVAPQGAADQRVDAVRADQDVDLVGAAVGEVQGHPLVVLFDALNRLVGMQYARRQGGQHALVELRPEQADETAAAAVQPLDL
jgi:hypothetical protein